MVCQRRGREAIPIELAERPYGSAAHERGWIGEQPFGLVCKADIPGITDRNQHIANEPVASRALDRRLRKQFEERCVIEARELGEAWRPQLVARGEFRLAAGLCELVPRTYRKTIIAAVNAIADRGAQFAGNRAAVLDGEVGDAAARIEPIRFGKRRRRTN